MILGLYLFFDDLLRDIQRHGGDIVLDLVHGLYLLLCYVLVGLLEHRLRLMLGLLEDLVALSARPFGGVPDDLGGLLVGGQQLLRILGLIVPGRCIGLLGLGIQRADLFAAFFDYRLDRLEQELFEQEPDTFINYSFCFLRRL